MPKTKVQSLVFSAMMVFCMVYCMTVYNLAWDAGALTYHTFFTGLQEMWLEYCIVLLLIYFGISHLAVKLASKVVNPAQDRPMLVILCIQTFTVLLAVPTVTLVLTFLHQGFVADWFPRWITLALRCFPMAYGFQIFVAGPLVRHLFRLIFRQQQPVATAPVQE